MTPDGLRRTLDKMLDELERRGMVLSELTAMPGDGQTIIMLVVKVDEHGE